MHDSSMAARTGAWFASLVLAAGPSPAWAQTEYRFSPVNQANIATAATYWNPIVAYVSEKSGVKLALKLGRTSADTTAFVLAKAFAGMGGDPRGKEILAAGNQLIGIPQDAVFIASDGKEYQSYRRFYQTAPAQVH